MFSLGIDIGSTTAKVVFLDPYNKPVFTQYLRHNAQILETITKILNDLYKEQGNRDIQVSLTGTAGMGLAERSKLPFVQEVVAAGLVVQHLYPEVRTLIDIGGEDGKIILFDEPKEGSTVLRPTIRMNGNCAGGTGSFIDQMATLLGCETPELSALSEKSTRTYPMASRCGVFAKTDVQTLMSRSIPREDIIASVYRAVAFQTVSSLSHGVDLRPKVLFAGGPLGFQPGLRRAFLDVLGLKEEDTVLPERPELLPALGAALNPRGFQCSLSELLAKLAQTAGLKLQLSSTLEPLFENEEVYKEWKARKESRKTPRLSPETLKTEIQAGVKPEIFLGIDSGSRTSKMVLIDAQGRLLASFYRGNDGDPLETVITGLEGFAQTLKLSGLETDALKAACSTGYGEELLQHAFALDYGVVETLAHFRAAQEWDPDLSFILDIGGQDMKAIFVQDRAIQHMDLNEACSSGTGSFLEGFALNLGMELEAFAQEACVSKAPRDLGTRCTVFMNSKVKQALREGAEIADISAGLAYSVIKNCFQKVLKIHNPEVLGGHIIAQGGTFKNPAVLRALELHVGTEVLRPDIAELMGAYGAALIARDRYVAEGSLKSSSFVGFSSLHLGRPKERKILTCKGCENLCSVTRMDFEGGKKYFTGQKCEKVFTNPVPGQDALTSPDKPYNMFERKRELLFDRPLKKEGLTSYRARIGIPRVLNMYEDFPFWASLFVEAGFEVQLSDPSTFALAEQGYSSVMSENVCFPAKIVHGHILNLLAHKVDRIFYPMIRHDRQEFKDSLNSFNCPVVTGYPEVIRSAINPQKNYNIPFDCPPMSFQDPALMKDACVAYLGGLGVDEKTARTAWTAAEKSWEDYRTNLRNEAVEARKKSLEAGRLSVLVLSRPYHADALINHKVPEMLTALGADVFSDDIIGQEDRSQLPGVQVLTQWAFPNRFYDAALWAGGEKNLEVIQFNSFGCGPDALAVDEVRSILRAHGKSPTLLRIDEVSSPGSLKLRVRSLLESVKNRAMDYQGRVEARQTTPVFQKEDRKRTIIAPMFAPFYTDFIVEVFRKQGYKIIILPMPDRQSVQEGLAYANHDICYPATIVIGDLIKALKSGDYDVNDCAVAITQTGGQCRASSYASLLKKALVNSGFGQVPVVTLSAQPAGGVHSLNEQPGFHIGAINMGLNSFYGLLYADVLAKLFYASSIREKESGQAWALVEYWIQEGVRTLSSQGPFKLLNRIPEVIQAFNAILANTDPLPKVGIVGEIYVKFNPFANNFVTDWLKERRIEADVPPLLNFFLQRLVTGDYNQLNNIEKRKRIQSVFMDLGENVINHYLNRVNQYLKAFAVPVSPFHTMQHLANGASKVLSLINQYGESWLIAGDIAGFIEEETNHVLCLQPFGCIANHVIAKGVEKRLKETYPDLSILFLDMDAGASEVNLANRLEFLSRSAWQEFELAQAKQERALG